MPAPTASPTRPNTIGIVAVARLAAMVAGVPMATSTSTFRRANDVASSGKRSSLPSA
jgi:hypothetical protein